jgi:uncharacterized membrane protein
MKKTGGNTLIFFGKELQLMFLPFVAMLVALYTGQFSFVTTIPAITDWQIRLFWLCLGAELVAPAVILITLARTPPSRFFLRS